jgi:nucleoside-diphosphate-sugar epimerase
MKRVSDLTLAKKVLGFAPKYDLVAGIRDLAEWLKRRKRG